ncbi:hypothetical protein E2562_009740 [Oryza meyeriana var. granulata]|uniref:Uncharacterized protein n=1 Tax=Oryza meyeriana var. granulata TaxID=110450 RepID=A0A6G1D1U4_9ORYZ|nr:hypothetical protein E2562_009740 [Oryza meyeriana var. granulata]
MRATRTTMHQMFLNQQQRRLFGDPGIYSAVSARRMCGWVGGDVEFWGFCGGRTRDVRCMFLVKNDSEQVCLQGVGKTKLKGCKFEPGWSLPDQICPWMEQQEHD